MLEFHLVTSNPRMTKDVRQTLDLVEEQITREFFSRLHISAAGEGDEENSGRPDVELTVSGSLTDFVSTIDALAAPSPEGPPGPNTFILDDKIAPGPGSEAPEWLFDLDVPGSHGMKFSKWLHLHMPAMPVVILSDREMDRHSAALHLPRKYLENHSEFARHIVRYLCSRWEMPFWEALHDYATELGRNSWHTPGHSGGRSFSKSHFLKSFSRAYAPRESLALLCDLSVSVDELGDLSTPYRESPMSRAMARSAETFGSARTLYATNGSSSSNKVMLMTLLDPGDVVILDRNCHKSIHQAMVISGTIPFYLNPKYNEDLGISRPLSFEHIADVLHDPAVIQEMSPRVFCLTTSTYEGVLFPIKEIAALCETVGVVFYADESWLPHGRFHPFYGPRPDGSTCRYNALGTGAEDSAHLVVQSTHKTLSALSQASMMHVSPSFMRIIDEALAAGREHPFAWLVKRFVDQDDFLDYLAEVSRYWVTTSPSYPIIASLDCATTQMAGEGLRLLTRLHSIAADLQAAARQLGASVGLDELIGDPAWTHLFKHDPLKFGVVVRPGSAAPGGPSHFNAFLDILRRNGIAWEKASSRMPAADGDREPDREGPVAGGLVLFLVSAGSNAAHAETLKRVLRESRAHLGWIDRGSRHCRLSRRFQDQVTVVPRDAHYAEGELVPLRMAGDRISCQMVVPYPPGIPSILPGLKVSRHEAQRILQIAARDECDVHGLVNRKKEYFIRVLRDDEVKMLTRRYEMSKSAVKQRLDFLAGYRQG